MKENKKQIIVTGVISLLLFIVLVGLIVLEQINFISKVDDIKNIIIGLFTGLLATTVVTFAIYKYKLKDKLNENYNNLFNAYVLTTFVCGGCDESLKVTDTNRNYKFLQRYKVNLENLKIELVNLKNNLALLDTDMFLKIGNRYIIFKDSKALIGYIDNVIRNIDKVKLILGELDQLETQMELQKLLTSDLSLFEEKKKKILDEFNSLMIIILTDSDRVRTLIFEIFKLYDQEDKKYNAVKNANEVKCSNYEKKDYGLKISKEKIKQTILNDVELLNLGKKSILTSSNRFLIDIKNSILSIINEMSLIYDENNEVISILREIEYKLDDTIKLNSLFQSKYYNFNWIQYFLEKGINYDTSVYLEFQPEKEKIINELNNIDEIKRINTNLSEITNIIDTKNLLSKIDSL